MTTTGIAAEKKTVSEPDDVRTFEKGRLELVNIGGGEVGRLTLEPGWRWSEHVKPLAGTELCEAPHFQYHVAGVLHILMADGTEFDAHPGDITALPSGHDAWVVGDEQVVVIDWNGASDAPRRRLRFVSYEPWAAARRCVCTSSMASASMG
jgi:hypothetical protein